MISIIIWSFLSYGLMNIVVYGTIFSDFRDSIRLWGESNYPLNKLGHFINGIVSCPMCFSFWGGIFLSIFAYSPTHEFLEITRYGSWFFDGIFSSGVVWAINSIVEWFEETKNRK